MLFALETPPRRFFQQASGLKRNEFLKVIRLGNASPLLLLAREWIEVKGAPWCYSPWKRLPLTSFSEEAKKALSIVL